MKIRVVALGHRMPAWVSLGWDEYARRMPKGFALDLVELKAEARGRGRTPAQILASEAERIAAACKGARVVAFDERGTPWTTRVLAETLSSWRDEGRDAALVIGSADGLAETVKREADAVVALSALTLPHGLVRVVVAEQVYRAVTLITRHPYHRE